jgi:bifunctional DNase/RNase
VKYRTRGIVDIRRCAPRPGRCILPAISARPSDAIALALRIGAPILASEDLLAEAGIEIPDQAEDEVERFKEFLDQINPEDFLG